MNSGYPALSVGEQKEVEALLETLLKTGQRLEELTHGEVDTAGDRDGRTLLLRGTQEQLRHSETARQAAILNALPENIALLNTDGIIVSVNESWRNFAIENKMAFSPGHRVGRNYLEICDGAAGNGLAEAALAATGIRSVLQGVEESFCLEYECNEPTEQRWFMMTVTPLLKAHQSGVIVMHKNITQRKQSANGLIQLAERLSLAAEVAGVGVWEWEIASNTLTWDATMFAMYGFSPMVPMPYERWSAMVHPEDLPLREAGLRSVIEKKVRELQSSAFGLRAAQQNIYRQRRERSSTRMGRWSGSLALTWTLRNAGRPRRLCGAARS